MEVRIAGVNIPVGKHADIALTSIYGIGRQTARRLCQRIGIEPSTKIKDLSEDKVEALRAQIKFPVEGELRRIVAMNIKRKIDIGSYSGLRHKYGLPLKGRTKTNARTRKAKRKGVK